MSAPTRTRSHGPRDPGMARRHDAQPSRAAPQPGRGPQSRRRPADQPAPRRAPAGRTAADAPQRRHDAGRSEPAPRRGRALRRRATSARGAAPRPAARSASRHARRSTQPQLVAIHFKAGNSRRRLVAVFAVSMLLFLAVIGRVLYLQTWGSDSLIAAGRAQRVSESILHAQRGTIFARDGGELALSVPSSTLIANPKLVTDPTGVAATLASMLGLSAEKQQALQEAFTLKEKSFVYVARQIDDGLAESVLALRLAGIDVITESKRIMPSGEVGRSVLGRTDIDGVGIAGLERQYDELLTGTDGERVREHDRNGRSIPGSGTTTVDPVPGVDLVLSIDRSLQFQVEQALLQRVTDLSAKGGTVVVMDTQTGEIYAIANVVRDPDTGEVYVTSANLAAVEAFEPGSVAKVFSLSSVVDQGLAGPNTTIDVPGYVVFNENSQWEQTIRDAEPHDTQPMTMRDILVHSSNIGTLELTGLESDETFHDYLSEFGFGQPTALGFPDESSGDLNPADQWQGAEPATISFGYGYTATSLQLTAAVNTVANGGTYVAPKLLLATIGADGEVVETDPSASHQVLAPETAATMTDMMTGVVCDGTGKDAQLHDMPVAGKTGTAYKVQSDGTYGGAGNRAYRASFVGFFPADNPQVTILVTIDEPDPTSNDRFGGKAAAPLFATVATQAIHELAITPTPGYQGCPAG